VEKAKDFAALFEKKKVSRFNQALLLGEPAAIRHKANQGFAREIRCQSRTLEDSTHYAGAKLIGNRAEAFCAAHDRF
jgi:hypothetical protein